MNVLLWSIVLSALSFSVVSVLTLVAVSSFPAQIFEGVCGNACQSSRVVCGNAHPVMLRLAHGGRRSALNEKIRTPQWAAGPL